MRHFTIASIELMLEGTNYRLRSSGVNGARRYWLQDVAGNLIQGSRSATLEGIRAFIAAANLAA